MVRVPLAWKNLTHDPRRLGVALGGIAFAVLLMCMQVGFENALFDSTVALINRLDADLVLCSKARMTLSMRETIPQARLYQAQSHPAVASASPLYIEMARSLYKSTKDGNVYPIRVLAFHPGDPVFMDETIRRLSPLLTHRGTALADTASKRDFGEFREGLVTDLSGQQLQIVGLFELGTDFSNDGNLVMSADSYADYFGFPGQTRETLQQVDLGLVRLRPGCDPELVKRELAARVLEDTQVYTREEFIEHEMEFWRKSTPIGFVFRFGVALGFVVGVIICYQILNSDISDHMPEFATLKAMGYRTSYFVRLVLTQSVLLSVLGFVPGVLASLVLYTALSYLTGLLMLLTPLRALAVLLLTIAMCVVSGFLAMRKLLHSDPAELF